MTSEKEILACYADRGLSGEEQWYLEHSVKRIRRVLSVVGELLPEVPRRDAGSVKLLDVGPHFLTGQIHRVFPDVAISTLGFENPRLYDASLVVSHFRFDLNDAGTPENGPAPGRHHLVVISEVIEHLHTPPATVLSRLRTLLLPGGFLVLTTPNALAASKRLKLLAGRHPYEMLRDSRDNPGHIREYTRDELTEAAVRAGFRLVRASLENYFIADRWYAKAVLGVSAVVPSLRNGIILVLRNPE